MDNSAGKNNVKPESECKVSEVKQQSIKEKSIYNTSPPKDDVFSDRNMIPRNDGISVKIDKQFGLLTNQDRVDSASASNDLIKVKSDS